MGREFFYSLSSSSDGIKLDRARLLSHIGPYISILSLVVRGGGGGGNITSSSKIKAGENTAIKDVENEADELPDSDFSKASARVFDKIYNGNAGVLSYSFFFND